jgi:hypothetical protein
MRVFTRDRRGIGRAPCSGAVELAFEDPIPETTQAELVELSARGFRALHSSENITPGLEVRYKRVGLSGRARVIWTHVLEGKRVSGFLILS